MKCLSTSTTETICSIILLLPLKESCKFLSHRIFDPATHSGTRNSSLGQELKLKNSWCFLELILLQTNSSISLQILNYKSTLKAYRLLCFY